MALMLVTPKVAVENEGGLALSRSQSSRFLQSALVLYRSRIMAIPCPPPMQSVARPSCLSSRFIL